MKRLLLFFGLLLAVVIGAFLSPIVENPSVLAQTNTFCASNLTCTVSAAWTFSSNLTVSGTASIPTASNLSGCQHVNANQTFAVALAAVSTSGCLVVDPGTFTVSANSTVPAGVTLYSTSGGLLSIATATTLTINGPIVAPATNIFTYVGTGATSIAQTNVEAAWFPGANIGVQINNAALAASTKNNNNTNGAVRIHVPPGSWSVPLGTIKPQADVVVYGDGPTMTSINCTGGSGICYLFNVGTAGGSYNEHGAGLAEVTIAGPGYPSGSGQVGTCLQVGDSTHASLGFNIRDGVVLAGCAIGITWGNNLAWGLKSSHTLFLLNTQSLVYNPNNAGGTENIEFDHPIFAPVFNSVQANDVVIGPGSTTTDIWFNNPSFDNSQFVCSNASSVGMTKPHFEYGNNTTTTFISESGNCQLSLFGPYFQYDPSSGSVPAEAVLVSSANLQLVSSRFNSNFAIANTVNATGSNVYSLGTLVQTGFTAGITRSGGSYADLQTINGHNIFQGSGTLFANQPLAFGSSASINGNLLLGATAPTILTHFNTSGDSILGVSAASFQITVGTGTAGSTGAITLPTAANGWTCSLQNQNRGAFVQQTANTTTSATFTNYGTTVGTPVNWTNSDKLAGTCFAF